METACPLCNTLRVIKPACSCGEEMLDSGPVTDYTGPYSPYYNASFEGEYCPHLFTCPACGNDQIIAVPLCTI